MGVSGVLGFVASGVLVWSSLVGVVADDSTPTAEETVVTFIATEDASFDEVFNSMISSNDAADVADFLDAQAEAAEPVTEDLGLADTSVDEAREVLADAAATAEDIATTQDADGAPASTGLVISPASFASHRTQAPRAAGVVRASMNSAAVAGSSTNNRFSWKFENRAYLRECSLWSCTTKSWLDYRLVTDPGKTTTRTNVQFIRGGEGKIRGVTLRTTVLSAGYNVSDVTNKWSPNVSGMYQWNSGHSSTKGKTFQMYYWLEFAGPGAVAGSYEYKSGRTSACSEPSPGAYRCLFP
jgi:hypothetical protein